MRRTFLIAACSAAACSTFAADLPVTRTDPVVVTATRFADRGGDMPAHVSVITAEDIRSSAAKTIPDLLAERAGIVARDLFGNNAASGAVDMRGFGVTGTQNTLVLIDGRRVTDIDLSGVQWSAVPLSAVERIEILRGGGSVVYGEGTTGGVINIITRSPDASSLRLGASVGSYDTREYIAEGSYVRDSVGVSLLGNHFESDGYRRNNRNRQTNALADLRWRTASGDLSLKLAADDQGIRLPGARLVQPSAGVDQLATDRRGTSTPLDWAQRQGSRAIVDWRGDTRFGEFTLGASWREKDQRSYFDFSGFPDYREVDLTVWSLTPRVKVDVPLLGRRNTLVAGVDWYRWDYGRRTSNSPANIASPVNDIDARQETLGVYVLDTLTVTRGLALTVGARRERFRMEGRDRFDATAPGGAFGSGAPPASQRLYEHAYELALRYELSRAAAVTAKTSRSYRFANVDEVYESSPAFTNQFQFLEPQTARAHELALDARKAETRGRAAVFVIDVDDEIRLDPFTTGVGNRNLPPSRRRGVEIEAAARPHPKLGVAASYTYLDARFLEGVLPGSAFTQQNVDLAGKRVPLVPRHKASVRAAWDLTAATRLSAVLSYVSEQLMDNDESNTLGVTIPAYTIADLKLTHRRGPWLVAASVNNVFAEKYHNYAVRSQFVADRYNAYPLPERNGTLSVEYQFR